MLRCEVVLRARLPSWGGQTAVFEECGIDGEGGWHKKSASSGIQHRHATLAQRGSRDVAETPET